VLTASRLESLQFRDSFMEEQGSLASLVYNNTLHSYLMKRFSFTQPIDLAVDNEKNIYITSFPGGKLVKINANGEGEFARTPALDGRLYGIDYRSGKIAVTDFKNDTVYIYNTKGVIESSIGKSGHDGGEFHGPEGVCFSSGGHLYVADSGNHRVQKFDSRGVFLYSFGAKGTYEGELDNPSDVACLGNRVYVTDTNNRRVACFDDAGNFMENILAGRLEAPRGINTAGDVLLIADEKKGLLKYNTVSGDMNWFYSWESENNGNRESNKFARLMSSVVDRDGLLYCLDYGRQAVDVFSPVQKKYANLDVEIVSVDTSQFPITAFYINVRDRHGNPLYALDRKNFTIVEDNASITQIQANYLKKKAVSVSTVLCVDRSVQNRDNRNELSWLADFYLKKMKKNDSIRVMNFNSTYWEGSPFDWSRRRTLKAVKESEYGEGKNIGSALYNAVTDLIPRLNRRAVIMITDGAVAENSFTQYSARTIVQYARSHFIPIYIISVREPDQSLSIIAADTGGAVIRPAQMDTLRRLYDDVKHSEEYRYVLIYSTFKLPSFRGWWSDVKIEVDYKGIKGVEYGGYFVP
jgi:DNA-binding beta-propeller fold protein YncE